MILSNRICIYILEIFKHVPLVMGIKIKKMRTMKPKENRNEQDNMPIDKLTILNDEALMYEEIWLEKIFGKLQIKDIITCDELFLISK